MEAIDPILTIGGMIVTFIATFVTVKVKQDSAERRYQEDNLRRDVSQKSQDDETGRLREALSRHESDASAKREVMNAEISNLRVDLAGYRGSYTAVNDRFTSLERAVRDGFRELKEEINQKRRADDKDRD